VATAAVLLASWEFPPTGTEPCRTGHATLRCSLAVSARVRFVRPWPASPKAGQHTSQPAEGPVRTNRWLPDRSALTGQSTGLTGLLPASRAALQNAGAASVSLHTTAADASALSAAMLTRWEAAEVVLRFWPGATRRVVKFCQSGYLMAGRQVMCGDHPYVQPPPTCCASSASPASRMASSGASRSVMSSTCLAA
jgi:hypothetical protein